ncbi:MAG: ABC transporter permease [Bacteroidales bacterium]|nr:ABC transporter permease [Bacteroidales bacterium]
MHMLKPFFRSIKNRKAFTLITIGGYALSMSVLIILTTFIIGEKSVDRGFENRKNIYRIVRSDQQSIVPETLFDEIKGKVPGVENMCLYTIQSLYYKLEDHREAARFMATNDDFLNMFSLRFIYKSGNPTLAIKENVILTQSFSKKLYGDKNPVGEMLEVANRMYSVAGVVQDIPSSSSLKFDALVNVEQLSAYRIGYHEEEHRMMNAFVMLYPQVVSDEVESKVAGMINHWKAFKDITLSLQPFSEVYFSALPNDKLEHANVKLIYLLSSIAIVILFMTIFNYVNLSLSGGYDRLNEIGIKKANGAGRKEIFRQIIVESLLISFLSMILALAAFTFMAPLFAELLDKKIQLQLFFLQPLVLVATLLLFVTTGILSGLYPALAFSGFTPLQAITHRGGLKNKGQRAGVIAVQFLITSCLLIALLVIHKQLKFVEHKNLGFNKEMLVRLNLGGKASEKWKVIKSELLTHPGIVDVSATAGSPMQIPGTSTADEKVNGEIKTISTNSFWADEDFLNTFKIQLIAGRDFMPSDSNVCLINEHLYKEHGWTDLTGKFSMGEKVIGVVKDFHYENLYTEMGNIQIGYMRNPPWLLNIKITGDVSENLETIKKVYTSVEKDYAFTFKFYDEWIQSMYVKEQKQARAIKVFALLAIIISCLGLIGFIEQLTQRKIKEIGIRKINGAKISEVIVMLNKSVVKWVVVGFTLAAPLSYYAMNKWLENFAYKTALSWWVFALSGLLALGIALLTVSWQSWRAATRNPVEALRYE